MGGNVLLTFLVLVALILTGSTGSAERALYTWEQVDDVHVIGLWTASDIAVEGSGINHD